MPLAGLSNDLIHVPLTDANVESLTPDTLGRETTHFFPHLVGKYLTEVACAE